MARVGALVRCTISRARSLVAVPAKVAAVIVASLALCCHAADAGSRSSTVIYASGAGVALDSDLMRGGGGDDTRRLQRLLDRAKSGRGVHLIIDGPALVSGLDVYSNTTIECTAGGGFYLKADANRAILRNAHRSRKDVQDRHITVRGCFFNGNRPHQRTDVPLRETGRYVSRETDGSIQSGIQFFGVHYLTLENVKLWNIRAFAVWVGNAKFIRLENITVDTGLPPYPNGASLDEQRHYKTLAVNDDGIHFQGPIQYLNAEGLKLRTVDDALAFTANEYLEDMTINNELGPYVGQGPITDVVVRNVILMEAHQGIRFLSKNQRIDRILIDNVTGTVRQRGIILSHLLNNSKYKGDFGSIIFSNIMIDPVASPPYLDLYPFIKQTYKGLWDVDEEGERPLFSLNSPIENLVLRSIATKIIDKRPIIRVGPDAAVTQLDVDMILHDPDRQAIPVSMIGSVEHMKLSLDWPGSAPIHYEDKVGEE